MKMKEIEVGKEYAVMRGSYGKRPPAAHVEGFENFNPHCQPAKVLETGIERISGFDYVKKENKTSKAFVKVVFRNRQGKYDEGSAFVSVVPVRNVVAPWKEYEGILKARQAILDNRKIQKENNQKKAFEHADTLIAEIAKPLGLKKDKHGEYEGLDPYVLSSVRGQQTTEEFLQNIKVSINYPTLLAIAEKIAGKKIDVPVLS